MVLVTHEGTEAGRPAVGGLVALEGLLEALVGEIEEEARLAPRSPRYPRMAPAP
jgi:CBS domain containing-hemolysin-like protein